MAQVLGIDIGGTGIKGAPVDVDRGTLAADRYRLLTPQPAVPAAVADVVGQVVAKFGGEGMVGEKIWIEPHGQRGCRGRMGQRAE